MVYLTRWFFMPKLNLNFKRFVRSIVPDKMGYFDEVKYKDSSILRLYGNCLFWKHTKGVRVI